MANVIGAISGKSKNLLFDGKKRDVTDFEMYELSVAGLAERRLFTRDRPSGRMIHP